MRETYLLRINEKIKRQLEVIAKDKGYSLNSLITIILNEYLDKLKVREEIESVK